MREIAEFFHSFRLFQFVGMNPFSFDKSFNPVQSRFLKNYSIFQISLLVLGFLGLLNQRKLFLNETKNDVGFAVDYFQLVGITATHLIIICESFYHRQTMAEFLQNLNEFDKVMKEVKNSARIKKSSKQNLIVLISEVFFYFGMILAAFIVLMIRREFSMITYFASYFAPHLVCCFRYIQVCNCVWFIKRRLEILNEKLADFKLKNEPNEAKLFGNSNLKFNTKNKVFKKPKPLKNFEQIILMRQMYEKLYNSSLMVNYSFGLSNLINITNDFIALTSNSFFMFTFFQNFPLQMEDVLEIIQTLFFSLPHLINIVAISSICHFTVHVVSEI